MGENVSGGKHGAHKHRTYDPTNRTRFGPTLRARKPSGGGALEVSPRGRAQGASALRSAGLRCCKYTQGTLKRMDTVALIYSKSKRLDIT